jgi:hypothetical protein
MHLGQPPPDPLDHRFFGSGLGVPLALVEHLLERTKTSRTNGKVDQEPRCIDRGARWAVGIGDGDPEGAIRKAYAEEIIVDVSHPAGRREVVVRPTPDSAHATVFDIEGGTVARMRSGTHPEVEPYLEGCG